MRPLTEILTEDTFHYLVRPLVEDNEISNCIKSDNFTKNIFEKWYHPNMVIYNPYFTCAYLHILKNPDNTFTLSIFSSIENEYLYKKSDDGIDKTWFKMSKHKTLEELIDFIDSKLEKYIKKWHKRDDPSQKNEKKILNINYHQYWYKCLVKTQ